MNILFLANRFPYPPYRGDKLKIYNLTKRLSENHNLFLVTFYEDRDELKHYDDIRPFFDDIEVVYQSKPRAIANALLALLGKQPLQLAYFKNRHFKRKLDILLSRHQIDVIHTQHLRLSQYSKDLKYPKILDLPDAFSLYFNRRKKTDRPFYNRLIDTIELRRLVRAEKVISSYDKTLVCSKEDQRYLSILHNANNVELLLNGVDLSTFDVGKGHDYSHSKVVLFTGNMDYAPNIDAVHYFAEEMWPEIVDHHPEAKFIIAGQRPVDSIKKLASKSVEVTGFVKDIKAMYEKASVVVAPLRFGAGTQNKVLEAMAMGVPTVCTHIGFEGLQIESGQGVVMAKTRDIFVAEVNTLLNDSHRRKMVGVRGLEIAKSRFSWDSIAIQLEHYLTDVMANNKS